MPRGRAIFEWDNGAPYDGINSPSSQLSEMPPDPDFAFNAAVADDFLISDVSNPTGLVRITRVRVAFMFFDDGFTPSTTWTNVMVTVYPNDPSGPTGDRPAGQPDGMGGHTGSIVGSVQVPAATLENETSAGVCQPYFQVDIPLVADIIIQKNVRYWLSVVPRYPAEPQTAWMNSNMNRDHVAEQGFITDTFTLPFWTDIEGNEGSEGCPEPQPDHFYRNVAFVLQAEDTTGTPGSCCHTDTGNCEPVLSPTECNGQFDVFTEGGTCPGDCVQITGACCDDTDPGNCTVVGIGSCTLPTQRFAPGVLCAALDPPCGTTDPGACCLPNGSCSVLTPTECSQADGDWHAGDCTTFFCPPLNDACADAVIVTNGSHSFTTLGSSTDGPVEVCSTVENDIWFEYTATCDGTLTVDLCTADYDSAVAVYDGCICPAAPNTALVCNDNACGTASYVTVPVTNGNCYLIRVGGSAGASGNGQMDLTCTPTGLGACCHIDQSCDPLVAPGSCVAVGDVYSDGQPCSLFTCAPHGACCLGDMDNSCDVTELDVAGFVEALLNPPVPDTSEFCRADVNQDDAVDGLDVALFLEKLLNSPTCESGNCPPPNDVCANSIVVTTSVTPFNTGNATTDGPIESCSTLDHDIWFSYSATCTGTLTVSLCSSTSYDSAVTIYDGILCPPGPALACDDNSCGAASQVSIPSILGNVYLIRVGGSAGASGTGQMTISCIPTGSGACCHAHQSCEVLPQVDCNAVDDVYTDGQLCSPLTCPPIGACCLPAAPCLITTEADCTQMSGGTYQGDATTCTPDPCTVIGACCLAGQSCQETTATECSSLSGVFQGDGTICTPNPCGPTGPDCCLGDFDNSCSIDDADVELFVNAVLDPPLEGMPEFCHADVNLDGAIDGLDVAAFVAKLLAGPSCEQTCCAGDNNGDGQLDGLDLQGFVDAYLSPLPPACGSAALCRADVDGNDVIDLADMDALVNLLMTDAVCPP